MLKKLKSFIIIFFFIVFIISPVITASIELSFQYGFSLSGLSSPITQIKFNDLDGDNLPEVLLDNGSSIVLYSITLKSILFSDSKNTECINSTILFDDVNRDSIPDILIGYYFDYNNSYGPDTICRLDFYDGFEMYQNKQSQFYEVEQDPSLPLRSPYLSIYLKALDFNHDGYNELLFSYDNHRKQVYLQFYSLATTGSALLCYSFPGTIIYEDGKLLNGIEYLTTLNDTALFVTTKYDIFTSQNINQNSYHSISTISIEILDNEMNTTTTITEPINSQRTGDSTLFINAFEYLCSGNIDASIVGIEFLVKRYWQQYFFSPDSSYDSTGNELRLYRLESPDSVELIWTVDNINNYSNIFYSDDYPGYFFTIKEATIYMFNGADGSINQICEPLIADTVFWLPSFDSTGYIVTIVNDSMSVYVIDQVTSVGNEPEVQTLPSSFILSSPYPNPFNSSTVIEYFIPYRSSVNISIYNITGQKVKTVVSETKPAGTYHINWDGKNDSAEPVSSGIYLIKATFDNEIRTVKAVLLK